MRGAGSRGAPFSPSCLAVASPLSPMWDAACTRQIPLPLPTDPVSEALLPHHCVPRGRASGSEQQAGPPAPGSLKHLEAVAKGISRLLQPDTSSGEIGRSPKGCVCPLFCGAVFGVMPQGWPGMGFRRGLSREGPLLAQETSFRSGMWEFFWKMASTLATTPKLAQPFVRNERGASPLPPDPAQGQRAPRSIFLCSPALGWVCSGRRRCSPPSTVTGII